PPSPAGLLEGGDGITPPKLGEGAAVELDQVEVVGLETTQAPLDAGQESGRPPVRSFPAPGVAALGEEVDLTSTGADGAPDEQLAVLVALGRVDHVEPGVERASEEPLDCAAAHALVADLGAAEAEHARDDVGPAEPASFHLRAD